MKKNIIYCLLLLFVWRCATNKNENNALAKEKETIGNSTFLFSDTNGLFFDTLLIYSDGEDIANRFMVWDNGKLKSEFAFDTLNNEYHQIHLRADTISAGHILFGYYDMNNKIYQPYNADVHKFFNMKKTISADIDSSKNMILEIFNVPPHFFQILSDTALRITSIQKKEGYTKCFVQSKRGNMDSSSFVSLLFQYNIWSEDIKLDQLK